MNIDRKRAGKRKSGMKGMKRILLDDMLTSILDRQGVSDSQVWIYQPEAITDSKEMVEVRHRLNTRRSNKKPDSSA